MSIRSLLILIFIVIFGAVAAYETRDTVEAKEADSNFRVIDAPPCIRMYDHLIKYSEKYGVPFNIAYGVARKETRYGGPFHWKYNPKLTSSAAAYGAMQVQVRTANGIWKTRGITKHRLLNDLEFNVETSMKLLAHLKRTYGSWGRALGAYNTGRPVINGYATSILNFKP